MSPQSIFFGLLVLLVPTALAAPAPVAAPVPEADVKAQNFGAPGGVEAGPPRSSFIHVAPQSSRESGEGVE
ncbi:hypothetical protein I316_06517 [Kwoniella heveanensis BCC8398]|uniref:Uncharacterized protein n=1 Tax=Kwoniella heveanensis BCC8398 TaxID=1296120 RepID=A0A1B9GLI8_9TREE|nr:hypothetical protein I316_06517 [Kwoniella heveanensis BCC8398]